MQIFKNFKAQNLKLRLLLSLAQIYYCYYLFKFRVLMVEKLCFYKSSAHVPIVRRWPHINIHDQKKLAQFVRGKKN